MKHVYRNPVLQQLQAAAGRPLPILRQLSFQAAERCPGAELADAELWFPEGGLFVLEQSVGEDRVELALLDGTAALPMDPRSGWQMRAIFDGRVLAMPAQHAAACCPEVLLQAQQGVMRQMARWAYCLQHHDPLQGLADRLCCLQQSASGASLRWSAHALPGCGRWLPAQLDRILRALQRTGAVQLERGGVRVRDAGVLRRLACGCHAGQAGARSPDQAETQALATASATLIPSTPADRMPPA